MATFYKPRVQYRKRGYTGGYVPGLDVSSLEAVTVLVDAIPGAMVGAMGNAAYKIGLELETMIKKPPPGPKYPLKWASKKQRAWYFAERRRRGLPIEYTRGSDSMSQKSGQSWVTQQITGGAVVGNPATYAPYLHSEEHQTAMHKATGWRTDEDVVEEMRRSGRMGQIIEAEIGQTMRSLIGQLQQGMG